MSKTILVTGATGNVGSELVRQLAAAGHQVRALVRDQALVRRLPSNNVTAVVGDYADPASLDRAMRGADAAYALTPVDEQAISWMFAIIDAAKRAGVRHVVKHSGMGANAQGQTAIARGHGVTDDHLRASGLSYTILQPNSYMQNLLWSAETIKQQGSFYLPLGEAKQSVIDVADIAAVAVKTLTEPGHVQKTYVLTGPEALSMAEQAARIAKAIDRPVNYVAVPPEAAEQAMVGAGMPAWNAHTLVEFFSAVATGAYAGVSEDVAKVLGRTPATFSDFVQRSLGAFR